MIFFLRRAEEYETIRNTYEKIRNDIRQEDVQIRKTYEIHTKQIKMVLKYEIQYETIRNGHRFTSLLNSDPSDV